MTSSNSELAMKDTPPRRIVQYLESVEVSPKSLPQTEKANTLIELAKSAGVDPNSVVRAALLKDDFGTLMAILPSDYLLDFSALCRDLNRELTPVSREEITSIFEDCEEGCSPPLPGAYELQAVVDSSLFDKTTLYLEPGVHQCLLELTQPQFQQIFSDAWQGEFAVAPEELAVDAQDIDAALERFAPKRMKGRIEETFELPAMPPMADAILRLRVDPHADATKLGKIVEKDPSLAAQVMSWSRSPYYGYGGQINSVEDAVVKVLGFDLVMNLALGIAIGKSMDIPAEGPLGLKAYWRHAACSAALTQKLAKLLPKGKQPPAGMVYLAGLLHNFGHLLLGQIFPPQYFLLNKYLEVNSDQSINAVEAHVLGVGHEQIGAWLMKTWRLPDEVVHAVKYHHTPGHEGEFKQYADLIFLANCLLKQLGIGDSAQTELPSSVLDGLKLTKEKVEETFVEFQTHLEELDMLAEELVG